MKRIWLGVLVGILSLSVLSGCVSPLRRPTVVTLLDNLGEADTTTRIAVEGRGGYSIAFDQSIGLRFEVTRPTVVTEVGGFIETFAADDPRADDVIVEIHPAHPDGRPNRDTVIASAPVAPRADTNVITYQPARMRALLRPGLYYALFATTDDSPPGAVDVIMVGSGQRIVAGGLVPYAAPTALGGVTHPDNYEPSIREFQGQFVIAELVRGVLLPATRADCRRSRWRTLADEHGNALRSAASCRAVLRAFSSSTP